MARNASVKAACVRSEISRPGTSATTNHHVAISASAISRAYEPAVLTAEHAVRRGSKRRPAAARNALRRDITAIDIAVAFLVDQPEGMVASVLMSNRGRLRGARLRTRRGPFCRPRGEGWG